MSLLRYNTKCELEFSIECENTDVNIVDFFALKCNSSSHLWHFVMDFSIGFSKKNKAND